MAELAPGLCVSEFVAPGQAMVASLAALGMPGPPIQVAMHPTDWERIPGAEREALLDTLVRRDVDRGLAILSDFRTRGWL